MLKLVLWSCLIALAYPAGAARLLIAPLTEAQDSSIAKALDVPVNNVEVQKVLMDAKSTIQGFLRIESCMAGYNGSPLNAFAAPGKVYPAFNYSGPMSGTPNHDRKHCLTVTRIQWVGKPAKNRLSFEVVYSADDSGEVTKRWYTLQAQEDGSWLFK